MSAVLRESTDATERHLALCALEVLKHPGSTDALILALDDPAVLNARLAAQQLGTLNAATALAPMISRLRRSSPHDDAQIALHIGRMRDPSKFDLVDKLLLATSDETLQGFGCLALGSCDDPRTIRTLLAHLGRHEDPGTRDHAGYALGSLCSAAATAAIVQALSDRDDRRRFGAVVAAKRHVQPAEQRTEPLLIILLRLAGTDPVMRVRTAAIGCLVEFADDRVVTALEEAVRGGGEPALAALDTVCATTYNTYVPLVLDALEHPEVAVRLKALERLPALGSPVPHRERILRLIYDHEPRMAEAARVIIAQIDFMRGRPGPE